MTSKIDTPEGREWLLGLLRKQSATIFFTKKDGSERKMVCTLMENEIPKEKQPKNSGKAGSDQVLPVFDTENQDWRSFRWDSVTKVEFTIA